MTPSIPGGTIILLTHGLDSIAYDVNILQKTPRNASVITYVPTLPDHDTRPKDLIHIPAEVWPETLT